MHFSHFNTIVVAGLLLAATNSSAANRKPVADAGADSTVDLATIVYLDASRSYDSDGNIRKYQWQQTQGVKIKLLNAKSSAASFTSPASLPNKSRQASLTFKLTVTDNKGAKAADNLVVTVADIPTCSAPQILQNGQCVTPAPSCIAPKVLENGQCVTPPPVCIAPYILSGGSCTLPTSTCTSPQIPKNGQCVEQVAGKLLNDTGVTGCSDTQTGSLTCPLSQYPGQDAEFGRDLLLNDDSDGHAGFSYTKIGANGSKLTHDAITWSCVQDNVSGLIWEVKTDDGGLRDKDLSYTHYSLAYDPLGLYGSAGDAAGFITAVNDQGLCGAKDWRLPTVEELHGLVDYSAAYPGPSIDQRFFPNTQSNLYWAADQHARHAENGWVVYFDDGRIFSDDRLHFFPIRLVRSGTAVLNISGGK